jgi:multiple antibiotic resistance protein
MLEWLQQLALSFLPLFFAIGSVDFIPIYLGMTESMDARARSAMLREAMLTAAFILAGFLLLGKAVLLLMGVSIGDFMVAGGILLVVLSIRALSVNDDAVVPAGGDLGIVPLATPLIAGPAAMATTLILLLLDRHGSLITLCSIVLNVTVAWMVLDRAALLRRLLGDRVLKATGKLSYILLASIAVMLIRKGLSTAP